MTLSHFVETAPLTVCGEWMADGSVRTANVFAHLGCPDCRQWVREHRLAPGGFPDPPEWSVPPLTCEVCSDGHHDVLRPCSGCGRTPLEKRNLRASLGGTDMVLDAVLGVRPPT